MYESTVANKYEYEAHYAYIANDCVSPHCVQSIPIT